eukprot:TRINITY_DN47862_c0_g1_i1.p1 TRINITY_DN47862_c0_g1~~TRINITY_DN47862_c0_g1_i1.p1  ORF type:complete len:262 (+),score=71.11 TRINITY_DN47862_c0_g1_i1:51-836(+)
MASQPMLGSPGGSNASSPQLRLQPLQTNTTLGVMPPATTAMKEVGNLEQNQPESPKLGSAEALWDTPAPEKKVRRPAKVGGLRWWLCFGVLGFFFFLFGFVLTGGVGFADGGKPPENCWHFYVSDKHAHCEPPLMAVETEDMCKLASAYIHGHYNVIVPSSGENSTTPGCYKITENAITWDVAHTRTFAEGHYFPVCRGTRIRDTQQCQEDWKHRINSFGKFAIAGCVIVLGLIVGYLLTCYSSKIAKMCRFSTRKAGEDA